MDRLLLWLLLKLKVSMFDFQTEKEEQVQVEGAKVAKEEYQADSWMPGGEAAVPQVEVGVTDVSLIAGFFHFLYKNSRFLYSLRFSKNTIW